MNKKNLETKTKDFSNKIDLIKNEIKKDIIGQEEVIETVLYAILSEGHVLLEGVPGVGKTRLVKVLSRVLNLPFSRIQFTPDLMPSDITGTNVLIESKSKTTIKFEKGPIFSNIVLADEINRATPKTQAALLEAMQEKTVTVMGKTYKINSPFLVIATQNPIEQEGTYELPEAQLDRFMFKVNVSEPKLDELINIVKLTELSKDEISKAILNEKILLEMIDTAKQVLVSDSVLEYATKLILMTSPTSNLKNEISKTYIKYGASPRAAQALIYGAKVRALINGRYNVSYDDINYLAYPVLRHRIKINFKAITENKSEDEIISLLLNKLKSKKK